LKALVTKKLNYVYDVITLVINTNPNILLSRQRQNYIELYCMNVIHSMS